MLTGQASLVLPYQKGRVVSHLAELLPVGCSLKVEYRPKVQFPSTYMAVVNAGKPKR